MLSFPVYSDVFCIDIKVNSIIWIPQGCESGPIFTGSESELDPVWNKPDPGPGDAKWPDPNPDLKYWCLEKHQLKLMDFRPICNQSRTGLEQNMVNSIPFLIKVYLGELNKYSMNLSIFYDHLNNFL